MKMVQTANQVTSGFLDALFRTCRATVACGLEDNDAPIRVNRRH